MAQQPVLWVGLSGLVWGQTKRCWCWNSHRPGFCAATWSGITSSAGARGGTARRRSVTSRGRCRRRRGLAAAAVAPGGDWLRRRRERARPCRGGRACCRRAWGGCGERGVGGARRGPKAPGRAGPRRRLCRCPAAVVLQNSLTDRGWPNGLAPGCCRYCCEALGHSEGFRGQAVLPWPHRAAAGRSVEKGIAWYLLLWTWVNVRASCSKDHWFEVFLYFSQFFWSGFSLGMFPELKFARRAADRFFFPCKSFSR